MATFAKRRGAVPSVVSVPVGTTWLYETDGTFEVPADGNYQVEMHGGGGGAVTKVSVVTDENYLAYGWFYSITGGGSGELYTLALTKGDKNAIKIGAGGSAGNNSDGTNGGATSFGSYTVAGGNGATRSAAGSAQGSLATSGTSSFNVPGAGILSGNYYPVRPGGYGNKNNTAQAYGNGGSTTTSGAQAGQPGAVIITYLGA